MLEVTPAARSALAEVLATTRSEPGLALRLVADDGSIELHPSLPQLDDIQFTHENVTVLVIDPDVAERLANRRMEAEVDGGEVKLTLTRTDDGGGG